MATATKEKLTHHQVRAAHNDKSLLDGLEKLLDDGISLGDISVEMICSAAGCAKPAFYRRYKDKKSILVDLFATRITPRDTDNLVRALGGPACEGLNLRELIYRAFKTNLENYRRSLPIRIAMAQLRYEPGVANLLAGPRTEHASQGRDVTFARLHERRSEMGIRDWESTAYASINCASLYIRERVFDVGKPGDAHEEFHRKQEKDDEEMLQFLVRQFLAVMLVEDGDSVERRVTPADE